MNATSNDKSDTSNRELSREDFGLGMLAALHLLKVELLDKNKEREIHAGFLAAFKVIESHLGRERLLFSLSTNRTYGTSADVFIIFSKWRGPWATEDSSGDFWRFNMDDASAEERLAKLRGGRELYVEAAEAFLLCYRGYK